MSSRETAVFPINEEYYLAHQQRRKKIKLYPTLVNGCKHQFPKPHEWHQLSSESHEQFEEGPMKRLTYHYVFNPKKPHVIYDFEKQAKRDVDRGFDYVNLSDVGLAFDVNPKEAPVLVRFQRKRVTKGSRTQRAFSKHLLKIARDYGLYQNIPTREFNKWRNNIYCLEATQVIQHIANSPIRPRDVTTNKLANANFLRSLNIATNGIVQVCAKILKGQDNWVFDGLVTEFETEEV